MTTENKPGQAVRASHEGFWSPEARQTRLVQHLTNTAVKKDGSDEPAGFQELLSVDASSTLNGVIPVFEAPEFQVKAQRDMQMNWYTRNDY